MIGGLEMGIKDDCRNAHSRQSSGVMCSTCLGLGCPARQGSQAGQLPPPPPPQKPAKGLLTAPLRARAGAPAALWAAWRGLERCTPQSASAHPAGRRETQAQCQMSLRQPRRAHGLGGGTMLMPGKQVSMAWHGPVCPTLPAWLAAHPCAHGSPGGSLAARAAGATPPACRPAAGWSAR